MAQNFFFFFFFMRVALFMERRKGRRKALYNATWPTPAFCPPQKERRKSDSVPSKVNLFFCPFAAFANLVLSLPECLAVWERKCVLECERRSPCFSLLDFDDEIPLVWECRGL